MKKNGVKSFVFSFLLSLLAVITVNKVVFRAPEIQTPNQKILKASAKSISLFSEKKDENSAQNKLVAFEAIENLVSQENSVSDSIIADNVLPDINIAPNETSVIVAASKPQTIIYQQNESVDINATNPDWMHQKYIDLAQASEIVLEKEIEEEPSVIKKLPESNVVYADISDTIKDEKKLSETEEKSNILYASNENIEQPIVVASADIENQEEFIPLLENQNALHESIDILNSAETSQIAMLEPNSLVSSIDSFEKPEEKNIAEVDLKQEPIVIGSWTQMSETSEPEDSPWVVAKGNRFAKNKIAQVDILAEEAAEQKKKLEKQKAAVEEKAKEVISESAKITSQNEDGAKQSEEKSPVETKTLTSTETAPVAIEKAETAQQETIQMAQNQENISKAVPATTEHTNEDQQKNINASSTQETSAKTVLSTFEEKTPETPSVKEEKTETVKENIITVHKEDASAQPHKSASVEKEITSEDIEETFKETEVSLSILPKSKDAKEKTKNSILAPKPLLIPSEESGTKLAYKMMQNLIIPMPEDIATDADIMPQLSSEPNSKPEKTDNSLKKEEKESGLFKSISSWFSGGKKDDKDKGKTDNKQQDVKKTSKKRKIGISLFERNPSPDLEDDEFQTSAPEIMPAELKLSFQPNRAEISGHTLRWIHAFADNARDNQGIYIEIRIDGTSSFALQQKRLNLLSSIFANRGVDFRKVNIIFTSREPNSFIIRNIKFNNNEEVIVNDGATDTNYQYW